MHDPGSGSSICATIVVHFFVLIKVAQIVRSWDGVFLHHIRLKRDQIGLKMDLKGLYVD